MPTIEEGNLTFSFAFDAIKSAAVGNYGCEDMI